MPRGCKAPISTITIRGKIAYVSLTHGAEAMIDVEDIPLVEGLAWRTSGEQYGHRYAMQAKLKTILMHRLIMNAPTRLRVDHIDNNGLNNRRSNLRLCSHAQNMANRCMSKYNKVGRKGVYPHKDKFRAEISNENRRFYLGTYKTIEEAAAAYAGAALVLQGEFAKRESKAKR